MITPRRISQDRLKYIYESAQARMEYNAESAVKATDIVNKHSCFTSEKDALDFAIEQMRNKEYAFYQFWAKIEKDENGVYILTNWWLSTDDIEVLESAEYIGMIQLYDGSRILSIIDADVPTDNVIAYY